MCQSEIFIHLLNKRLSGDHEYYSMTQIEKELYKNIESNPSSIRRKVNRLYATGFLDVLIPKGKGTMYWRRRFRIKDIYLNNKKK